MDTYSNIVYPTNGPQMWLIDDQNTVTPPVMKIVTSQPKKEEQGKR